MSDVLVDRAQAREVILEAGDVQLSGIRAEPPNSEPRAVIVGLPGGGMSAGYFHGSAHPNLSLLTVGAGAGFSVVSLDRPGYGRSSELDPARQTPKAQAEIIGEALARFEESNSAGAGFILVGHSFGAMVAVWLAATVDLPTLRGIAGSGMGLRFAPGRRELLGSGEFVASSDAGRDVVWGPRALYPPDTFVRGMIPTSRGDIGDKGRAAVGWPDLLPELAELVEVPVQHVLAEHEGWFDLSAAALDDTRRLFRRSPYVDVGIQRMAGHNISLGWAARAYHARVVAFAEECLLIDQLGAST